MVRYDPECLASLIRNVPNRMKSAWICPIVNTRVSPVIIKPTSRMVIPQPFCNKNRAIGNVVCFSKKLVHEIGGLALVAFVNTMQNYYGGVLLLVFQNLIHTEGLIFKIISWVDQYNQIDTAIKIIT